MGLTLVIKIFQRYISFVEVHNVQHTVPISWRYYGLCNTVTKAAQIILIQEI